MYSKLSLKNVQRSFKDYAIYFFTLTFAIALFFTFNSIESQRVMFEMNASTKEIFKMIREVMGLLSIFVAVILGFLVIYANNFLIKRRKKEFGIYSTLGMSKTKISKMLVSETVIIGVFSLIIGSIVGIFASQGLSLVTAKIFNLDLKLYKFVFSTNALINTILCFGVIFIFVAIFNTHSISKYKLIDLIYGSKKNEKLKLRNTKTSIVLLILSILMLIITYVIIVKIGIKDITNNFFYLSIILGIMGTLLFFMSLSGALMKILKDSDNIYLKNLNLFVIRQIGSKINTNVISMAMISLMLFITICVLSSGIGMSKSITSDLDFEIPYDAVIYGFKDENGLEILKEKGIDMNRFIDSYVSYTTYESGMDLKNIIDEKDKTNLSKDDSSILNFQQMDVITVSDYNKLMKLQKKEAISLDNNEYAIYSRNKDMITGLNNFLGKDSKVNVGGKEYSRSKYKKAMYVNFDNIEMTSDLGMLVLPDNAVTNLKEVSSPIVLDLNDNFKIKDAENLNEILMEMGEDAEYKQMYQVVTKNITTIKSMGTSMLISYIGIYLGVIFLITSGSVLAIQQLSEASDNIERYALLRKIGADKATVNKALFTQIGVYFLIPLSLAIVHSIVGLKVSNEAIREFGHANMISNIIYAAVFIGVVYGLYFLITFIGAKNILKKK